MNDFKDSIPYQILSPHFSNYQGSVEDLIHSFSQTLEAFETIPEEYYDYSYAPGKWTLRQVMMHIIDTTQVLGFRLLVLARGEHLDLPAVDENLWVQNISYAKLDKEYLMESYLCQIKAIQMQLYSLIPQSEHWITCNGTKIHFHEMILYIIGHEQLHLKSIWDKYLNPIEEQREKEFSN